MKNIYIMYADAGGGHRSLMETFTSILKEKEADCHVEGLDLFWLLSQIPSLPKIPKKSVESYNYLPHRFLNFYLYFSTFLGMQLKKILLKRMVKGLSRIWEEKKPNLVISVYPFFNDALYQSLEGTSAPFITFVADYGEFFEKLWIVPQDQYYICNDQAVYTKILQYGIDPKKVLKTSGFLLPKVFYEPHYEKKNLYRKELGLHPTLFTIVIVFGAYGSSEAVDVFESLSKIETPLQLIFITGKGKKCPTALKKEIHHKVKTLSFSKELHKIFAASDALIGKPGPGIISQAISQQLPVIIKDNQTTLYQEYFVAKWVKENQFGIPLKDLSESGEAVLKLLQKENLEEIKERLKKHQNRAYFEIAEFIHNKMTF